jgi:Dolichyl-phosphate-mannose-protein mannosyltransferase
MKYLFLLTLICFISILGLFHPGFPQTHDGDVHLLRLTNFYQSLQEGNVIPRWAANVNFGYGQPVFEFFYPYPSYLASVFHLIGFSFADSLKIILMLAMVLSGITMYLWLSNLFTKQAGFIGGLLYVFAPFRFVDTYVRGDIGESLAFVFIPLVLYCIYKISKSPSFLWCIFGGISLALLILTHNVISLMFLPFILFYGFFCWLQHSKKKLYAGYFFWIIVIGFALSAFFWMPGLLEGKYTLRNIVTKGEYKDRFVTLPSLFYGEWSYGGTGLFTVQLGILQWVMLFVSLVCLLGHSLLSRVNSKNRFWMRFTYQNDDKKKILILGTIMYTLLGIFFMLPQSNFIWSKILLLQNFQFPWRFLAVTTFGTAVLGAYLMQFIPKKYMAGSLVVIVCLVLFLNKDYMHAKGFWNRPDTYFAGVQRAPADTGESSPIWGVRFMEQGFKNSLEVIQGDATIQKKKRTTTEHIYQVHVNKKTRFLENTLYFPGWEVLANGQQIPVEFQDQQYRGLITFYLDPGNYTIDIKFVSTKLRKIADMISLVSIASVLLIGLYIMVNKFILKD